MCTYIVRHVPTSSIVLKHQHRNQNHAHTKTHLKAICLPGVCRRGCSSLLSLCARAQCAARACHSRSGKGRREASVTSSRGGSSSEGDGEDARTAVTRAELRAAVAARVAARGIGRASAREADAMAAVVATSACHTVTLYMRNHAKCLCMRGCSKRT